MRRCKQYSRIPFILHASKECLTAYCISLRDEDDNTHMPCCGIRLPLCTQIMMREADPALLAELLSSLLGTAREGAPNNNDENVGSRARRITGKSTSSISTSRTTTRTSAVCAKNKTTALGPLQPRDQNSPVYRGLRATTPPRRIVNTGLAAAGKGVGGIRRTAGGAAIGTSRDAGMKGRRMGTPTKDSVGDRLPERKSTRRNSPQKNPGGGGNGVRGGIRTRGVMLSKDQQQAVDLVLEGKSVFFTGEYRRKPDLTVKCGLCTS